MSQLRNGNSCLEKQVMEVARLVNDEEMTADLKSKGKNTGCTRDHMINSCQGKVAGVIW